MQTILSPDVAARMSERFDLVRRSAPAHAVGFGEDVRAGLGAARKRLPPKYFYDDLGSALFEAICLLPEYGLTRAETEILMRDGREIAAALPGPLDVVELGSGSGAKTRIVLEALLERQARVDYHPIDISEGALAASAAALVARYPRLHVHGHASDYFEVLGSMRLETTGRVLALVLGSNIGNYEPDEQIALLRALRSALQPGDGVLVGTDMKRDPTALELAYADPTGVTSAFEKNILGRINRELGGRFDLRRFTHIARYDAAHGRVDSFLLAEDAHRVRIDALDLEVSFRRGEAIHTESSYKFSPADIGRLADGAGFRTADAWDDAARTFRLSLLVA